jgi:hypothetical protein
MLDLNTILTKREHNPSQEIDNELVMISIHTGRYYSMNALAKQIWHWLDQPISAAQICQLVLAEYEIDSTKCQQDVLSFLQDLCDQGLIIPASEQ